MSHDKSRRTFQRFSLNVICSSSLGCLCMVILFALCLLCKASEAIACPPAAILNTVYMSSFTLRNYPFPLGYHSNFATVPNSNSDVKFCRIRYFDTRRSWFSYIKPGTFDYSIFLLLFLDSISKETRASAQFNISSVSIHHIVENLELTSNPLIGCRPSSQS